MSNGLIQLTSAEIRHKINHQKLFGVDDLFEYLFNFCKICLTADQKQIENFSYYDLTPSVLLYGVPNTGKTTLCYSLFDKLKREVTPEINFYYIDIGRMLDPALGQSSRNIGDIFDDLKSKCKKDSSVFLLLDELDTFCMSRSRTQEHDAIRRAMTTLMLELDKLHPSKDNKLLIFGITNIPQSIDTAVVRRFSLKKEMQTQMDVTSFNNYLEVLGDTIKYSPALEIKKQLYDLYQQRNLTAGDVKNFYKEIYIDFLCKNVEQSLIEKKIIELFSQGFSTSEHLAATKKELIGND
ncbi:MULTISPECIES: ATP-binding protein [Sphaerospermopsis]|uniref:AAA ATPase central domain protein n=1 Tax=Sphaerospermopsis reniformis TaxID=531300 RepID=A0A480A041_9CYAN|nr:MULTISPECIES: ATP-binding protein [Sphaerospermopsis]MBD2144684.1 AAA family ATPase [Sphaerospermopsis sp. FACHB-1194]GCL35474.1 AAA ATPase central domain protein [Sphaerospermopsis reniformis]